MFVFEKPWLTTGAGDFKAVGNREQARLAQTKSGLRLLIAAMSVIFFLTLVTYLIRMKVADWQPLPEPWLLWANTAFLLFGSVAMQGAVQATRAAQNTRAKIYFLLGGLFAWSFLLGQLWAWQQLNSGGYFIASNPANSFFYLVTALHGLHLLGGLGVWVYSLGKMKRQFQLITVRSNIELCAIYWHFLLIVWAVLYGLLLFT